MKIYLLSVTSAQWRIKHDGGPRHYVIFSLPFFRTTERKIVLPPSIFDFFYFFHFELWKTFKRFENNNEKQLLIYGKK